MKEVTVKVVNSSGHAEYKLKPPEALQMIRDEVNEKGKWLYIDGKYVSVDTVTEQDLTQANDITVVNRLVGG